MSEKRFIRIKNENGISIKDTKTNYERYYAIAVLDDLNELNDENEQLKRENKRLRAVNQSNEDYIRQLQHRPMLIDVFPQASELIEENEELRKEMNKYKPSIYNKKEGDWKWNVNNDTILNIGTGVDLDVW